MAASAASSSTALPLPLSPPLPLSKRSSSKNALRDASPPSTPPNKHRRPVGIGKGKGKGKEEPAGGTRQRAQHQHQIYQQQYDQQDLHDYQKYRNNHPYLQHARRDRDREFQQAFADPRHSHGLSWSSNTRDSLVDNLLLSLDGISSFPSADPSGHDDNYIQGEHAADLSRQAALNAMNGDLSRHNYSSSIDSENDRQTRTVQASPESALSSPAYRNRRSVSISNLSPLRHQKTVGARVRPSKHSVDENANIRAQQYSKSQTHINGAGSHGRGYSDASSADFNYAGALEAAKLALGGTRSVSMDHIQPASSNSDSVLARGRPVPSVFSKYENSFDAAPEPMVPAGPRKIENPTATGPVYVNATSKSGLRKTTTHTDLRNASLPVPAVPPEVREKASDFVRASSMRDLTQAPPGLTQSAASTPATASRNDAASPPNMQRERPGFFKRVFGGSRSNDRADTLNTTNSSREAKAVSPTPPIPKSDSRHVSADQAANAPRPPPQPLNKKSSSFFRRRKKSTSEAPPPPLPLAITPAEQPRAQASPSLSSLRKVMDPYLTENRSAIGPHGRKLNEPSRPTTTESVLSSDLDIFHSGYTPPPDATLGSRSIASRERRPSHASEHSRLKVKGRKNNSDGPPSTAGSRAGGGSLYQIASHDRPDLPTANGGDLHPPEQPKVSPLSEDVPYTNGDMPPRNPSNATVAVSVIEASQEMREFAAGNNVDLDMQNDSWLVTHDRKGMDRRPSSKRSQRLILRPTPSEEGLGSHTAKTSSVPLPTASSGSLTSRGMVSASASGQQSPNLSSPQYYSALSLPLDQLDGSDTRPSATTSSAQISSPAQNDDLVEYKERARRIFDGDEEDVTKMEAASWLGESKTLNTRTLHEYMSLFDFSQMNVLQALRTLCGKLVLRGETQQFDRIITALSSRWCECNRNHGFKAQDVVHTICYSLILLNTDLHLADIGEKMSRNAYVKNTLPTIRRVVTDAAPHAFDDTVKPGTKDQSRPSLPWMDMKSSSPVSPSFPPDTPQEQTSFDSKRLSFRPGMLRADTEGWSADSAGGNASNALVGSPWTGSIRGWEAEVESLLKHFFASIRNEPLPLLGLSMADQASGMDRNLSVNNLAMKRSGSVVSKAASDAMSHRSKPGLRNLTLGWQGRNARPRPKLYGTTTMSSSRTSFDDSNSLWSPAQSSTWSKNSAGKTLTSTSMNSLAGQFSTAADREYKHAIGFATALSNAIIREEAGNAMNPDSESFTFKGELLDDETLTLEGAPWAKEGMVRHKHHLDGPERKSKERSWNECFAVVSKGKLTLFNFNTETKTRSLGRPRTKQGSKAPSIAGTRVGGGDWMDNAEQLGVFILRHTISSTLPPPGYSKARPYVWALSLPSGAVHLFQVGTPEIAEEWMSTANYWSARLSKEPLSGGVSNIEYGWSEAVINPALLDKSESFSSPPPSIMNKQHGHMHTSSSGTVPRPSIHSSLRSSFDVGGSSRQRLPGDKIHITDWSPPSQSVMASQLVEVDQLRALTTYVANVETELEKHNDLKHAIELAFSPRHSNYGKAMSNWQRKSDYLLREVVKFRTYIDSLIAAQKQREDIHTRRSERSQQLSRNTPATAEKALPSTTNDTSKDETPRSSNVPPSSA